MKKSEPYYIELERAKDTWNKLSLPSDVTEDFMLQVTALMRDNLDSVTKLKRLATGAPQKSQADYLYNRSYNLFHSAENVWQQYFREKEEKRVLSHHFCFLDGSIRKTPYIRVDRVSVLIKELEEGIKLVESLDPTKQSDIQLVKQKNQYFHQIYLLLHTMDVSHQLSFVCTQGELKTIYRLSDNLEQLSNIFINQTHREAVQAKKRQQKEDIASKKKDFEIRFLAWKREFSVRSFDFNDSSDYQIHEYGRWYFEAEKTINKLIDEAKVLKFQKEKVELIKALNLICESWQKVQQSAIKSNTPQTTPSMTHSYSPSEHQQRVSTETPYSAKKDVKSEKNEKSLEQAVFTHKEGQQKIDYLCKNAEEIIQKTKAIEDYRKLSKNALCKWALTLKEQISLLKAFTNAITEDTLENRKSIMRVAPIQGELEILYKRFYSASEERPAERKHLTAREKRLNEVELMKVFTWGKKLFPEHVEPDDKWYENDSRLVAVAYDEDIQTYLKTYIQKVCGTSSPSFEIIDKEDNDEWGWLNMTHSFIPFCTRYIKTLGNGTKLYHFYTFKTQLSNYGYDFDEAITDRIYWLNEKGIK